MPIIAPLKFPPLFISSESLKDTVSFPTLKFTVSERAETKTPPASDISSASTKAPSKNMDQIRSPSWSYFFTHSPNKGWLPEFTYSYSLCAKTKLPSSKVFKSSLYPVATGAELSISFTQIKFPSLSAFAMKPVPLSVWDRLNLPWTVLLPISTEPPVIIPVTINEPSPKEEILLRPLLPGPYENGICHNWTPSLENLYILS